MSRARDLASLADNASALEDQAGGFKTVGGTSILGSGDISISSIPETASMSTFPVGAYNLHYSGGWSGSAALFETLNAATTSFNTIDLSSGNYTGKTINYGTWAYMGRIYGVGAALVVRVA